MSKIALFVVCMLAVLSAPAQQSVNGVPNQAVSGVSYSGTLPPGNGGTGATTSAAAAAANGWLPCGSQTGPTVNGSFCLELFPSAGGTWQGTYVGGTTYTPGQAVSYAATFTATLTSSSATITMASSTSAVEQYETVTCSCLTTGSAYVVSVLGTSVILSQTANTSGSNSLTFTTSYINASTGSLTGVTPGTWGNGWWPDPVISSGQLPTQVDLWDYAAYEWTAEHGQGAIQLVGAYGPTSGTYSKNGSGQMPRLGTMSTTMIGWGTATGNNTFSTIKQTAATANSSAEPMYIHYPDPSGGSQVTQQIVGVNFVTNGLACGAVELDGELNSVLQDDRVRNNPPGTGCPSFTIGGNETGGYSYQITLNRLDANVNASLPNYTPAQITLAWSGGVPTPTLVSGGANIGGSGFTGTLTWPYLVTGVLSGSDTVCAVLPTFTTTVSSGVITGVTTATNGTCSGATTGYLRYHPAALVSCNINFQNASDSEIHFVTTEGLASSQLCIAKHGLKAFYFHPTCGAPNNYCDQLVSDTQGGSKYWASTWDSIDNIGYNLNNSASGSPVLIDGADSYWNSSIAGFQGGTEVYHLATGAVGLTVRDGLCGSVNGSNGQQTVNNYMFVSPTGPVTLVAGNSVAANITATNNMHCDGTYAVDNWAPGTSTINALNAGVTTLSGAATTSTPAVEVNSTPYAGTSSTPGVFDMQWGSLSSITGFNTAGTGFSIRAPLGFTGDLVNWYVGTSQKFDVNQFGALSAGSSGSFQGSVTGNAFKSNVHCASAASPAVCSSAPFGFVSIAAGSTTVIVDSTAVTANSTISINFTSDSTVGTALSVTCNSTYNTPYVSARTAGTSFTITVPNAISTNPDCFTYSIFD